MAKIDYFPRRIGDQRNWLQNYKTEIATTGPLLGLTPVEVTENTSENEAILIHTFLADDELQLEIIAATPPPPSTMVQFYLATTPGGTDSTAVAVEANVAPTSITAAAFGIINYATHRYLTAINTNAMQLKYVVELE